MMKKILVICLAVLCLTTGAARADNMFHVPEPAELNPGEIVEVPIMASTDADCKGYSLSIRFDPAVLEVLGCECAGCVCESAMIVEGCDPADLAAGMFKLGVVYGFSCPPTIPAGEHCLVKLLVRAKEEGLRRWARLNFEDIDLSKNRLTACDGSTLTPTTVNKRFKIHTSVWQVKPAIPPSRKPGKETPKQAVQP
jgi:hypothetical protein